MGAEISIRDVHHQFGTQMVLKGIQLEVQKGEIFGLLGPSGAGKTTLINILTGQLTPTGGGVEILGKQSTALSGEDYMQMGIMMDNFGLYERMSCFDNLKFYEMVDGRGSGKILEILEYVGLKDAAKKKVSDLSKGMRNRLSFARVLLRSPRIMFLDEPTSGLDPMTVEAIHELILQEKEKGTTIFLTTHNMHEAEKLCDHIALLNEGNIVEFGAPEEICRRYNHQKKLQVHLKDGSDLALAHTPESGAKIAELLRDGMLETIHSTEPDLETVFMELTGKGLDK
ncbi:MAG: ABC transporter ATP-binding protein [Lachnospiraceae bacterium]|nr:ABC transporter ATP-binding protein [Lachnospiraceae bacterium]